MHQEPNTTPSDSLLNHKLRIEHELKKLASLLGQKTLLSDACAYALLNGGKRFRPILTFLVAEALGDRDVAQAALAIECFHTASLVVDDLPCMDNDALRRNKPTVHKVYGEGMALLVSYALISEGYACIVQNSKAMGAQQEQICLLALENVTFNTGIHGATGGQFLDVLPPDLSLDTLKEAIHKKTVSLFEIAFVFGWLFGGGDVKRLDTVKQAASHFGMAFQIADDLEDMAQDKANKRSVNLATVMGVEAAKHLLHEEQTAYLRTLQELGIATPTLVSILNF